MKNYPLYDAPCYDEFRSYIDGTGALGEKPAITCYTRAGEPVTHSFAAWKQDVDAFAEALHAAGLAGRHVAIVSENCYEYLVAFVAIASVGGVAVLVDIEQTDEMIRSMIVWGDAEAIVLSAALEEICAPLGEENSLVTRRIVLLGDPAAPESYERFCAMGRQRLDAGTCSFAGVYPDPEQTALIVYTSGTTGDSKPVMHSQRGFLRNIYASTAMLAFEERVFSSLPLYHTYGLCGSVLGNLSRGMHLCINGNLRTMIRDLRAFDPHCLIAVPLILEVMYQRIWQEVEKAGLAKKVRLLLDVNLRLRRLGLTFQKKKLDELRIKSLGSLHGIICGGAHLQDNVADDMTAMGVVVYEGYGITECAPHVSVNRNRFNYLHTTGPLLPEVEVKFVDDEIYVRGPSVMQGYYKQPEQTAEAFDGDWFKTGDLGFLDKHGCLHITGRKKNLIVFKNGKKASPEEIEAYVREIPLVKDVVAYGAANGDSADDVRLAVMVLPDQARCEGMTSYDILQVLQAEIDRINAKLPAYKQIQSINLREEDFKRTASRKIRRDAL